MQAEFSLKQKCYYYNTFAKNRSYKLICSIIQYVPDVLEEMVICQINIIVAQR